MLRCLEKLTNDVASNAKSRNGMETEFSMIIIFLCLFLRKETPILL